MRRYFYNGHGLIMKNKIFLHTTTAIMLIAVSGVAGTAWATPVSSEISLNTAVGFDPVDPETFNGNSDSASFSDSTTSIDSPFTGTTTAISSQSGSTIQSTVAVESTWNDSFSGDINFAGDVNYEHTRNDETGVEFGWNMFNNTWSYTFAHENSGQFILNWDATVFIDDYVFADTDAMFKYQVNGEWFNLDHEVSTIAIDITEAGIFEFGIGWTPYGPNGAGFYSYPATFDYRFEMVADWEFVQDPIDVPEPAMALILLAGFGGIAARRNRKA